MAFNAIISLLVSLTSWRASALMRLDKAGARVIERGGVSLFEEANADVAGMDHRDLRRDRDFKKAVKYIVQRCSVTGYVEDDYLHSSDISS